MLIPLDIPPPDRGVWLRYSPEEIAKRGLDGCMRLHNLRLDEGITHNRPGTTAYLTAPDAKRVIDGFTVKMRDGTVHVLRCVADGTRYDTGTAWAAVTLDAAWTGGAQDRFWAAVVPWAGTAKGRILISNGIGIKKWDGVPANTMSAVTGADPGRYGLLGPDQRAFVAWLKTGGGDAPRLVRWSVPLLPNGSGLDWTDPGSGAISVDNDSWEITATWVQNERIWIGKERSIVALDPTGLPRDAYGLSPLQSGREGGGDGPLPGSVVQFGNSVAMLSHRDALVFDGVNLTPVGAGVVRELYKRLNDTAIRSITSIVDMRNGRVGWGLPFDGSSFPTEIYWLELKTGRWETESRGHSALFFHGFSAPIYIDGLSAAYPPGKINDLPGVINALSPPSSPTPKVMIGRANGTIGILDDDATTDFGAAIIGDYQSAMVSLVGAPVGQRTLDRNAFTVLDKVNILLADRGQTYTIEVQASTDGGASWTSLGTLTMTSTHAESSRRLVRRYLTARYPAGTEAQIRIINQTTGAKWGFGTISLHFDPAGRAV